jgi:hypothetical protein
MTEDRDGPSEKDGGPGATNARADHNTSPEPITTNADSTCPTGKCELAGVVCVCSFYENWEVNWSADDTEPVPVQLRRRRMASYRCARLKSGRRDPISRSIW